MVNTKVRAIEVGLAAALVASPAWTQPGDVEIRTEPIRGGVHILYGQGGNIGVSVGEDGVLMIDDQYAPLSDRILAAIDELSEAPVRFLVNTHHHQDHTGGNENIGKQGAVIVAHENVRARLSVEQVVEAFNMRTPPSPKVALPVVTFADSVTLHWNGDEIDVIHVDNAHTDGDSIVHFKKANVFHMGDCYFNGMYPFIDPSSGGAIDGVIRAADLVLERANPESRVIPGHGPLSSAAELRSFRDMLVTVRDRIQTLIDDGKTKDEVLAAKPTADLDAKWGQGFLAPDRWVGFVYDGMIVNGGAQDERR